MNTPRDKAAQVIAAWLQDKSESDAYPINCIELAKSLGVNVSEADLDLKKFIGCLYITDDVIAILYNKNIKEEGRKNFTIAHELGHYFLHQQDPSHQVAFRTLSDIQNQPHSKQIEREADQFAAYLLMPESDFLNKIQAKSHDIELVLELAKHYGTSATATCCHLIDLSEQPLAAVSLNADNTTRWYKRNHHFKDFRLEKGAKIDISSHSPQQQEPARSDIWFPIQSSQWSLMSSSLDMEEYSQRLYLISGNSA